MKKLMLMAALSVAMIPNISAQTSTNPPTAAEKMAAKPRHTPEEKAAKDADHAEKQLGLSADQKTKWRSASLDRIKANAPLRDKMKASADKTEKQELGRQMISNAKKFDDTVNGFLSPEQKTKWEQAKQERKEAHKNGRHGHKDQPAAPGE